MTTEGNFDMTTFQANATLNADCLFKAITIGGTIAASPLQAGGVCRSQAVPGQGVSAIYKGECKLKVGAAINTVGFPLTITTSGWFIANATSGSATIGRALTLASSGDMVRALVDFSDLSAAAVS